MVLLRTSQIKSGSSKETIGEEVLEEARGLVAGEEEISGEKVKIEETEKTEETEETEETEDIEDTEEIEEIGKIGEIEESREGIITLKSDIETITEEGPEETETMVKIGIRTGIGIMIGVIEATIDKGETGIMIGTINDREEVIEIETTIESRGEAGESTTEMKEETTTTDTEDKTEEEGTVGEKVVTGEEIDDEKYNGFKYGPVQYEADFTDLKDPTLMAFAWFSRI